MKNKSARFISLKSPAKDIAVFAFALQGASARSCMSFPIMHARFQLWQQQCLERRTKVKKETESTQACRCQCWKRQEHDTVNPY